MDLVKLDLGELVCNLNVILNICNKSFLNWDEPETAMSFIKHWGQAIVIAEEYLAGDWLVTNQGYLIKGHNEGLPQKNIRVDIDPNVENLNCLQRRLKGLSNPGDFPGPHGHFKEGGIDRFETDGQNVYLDDVRRHGVNNGTRLDSVTIM